MSAWSNNLLTYMDITMLRYKIVSFLALMCSSVSYAGGAEHPVDTQPLQTINFYAGGSIGTDILQDRNAVYDLTETPPAIITEHYTRPATGWAIGPAAGMTMNFNPQFFISGELFYHWTQPKTEVSDTTANNDYTKIKKFREFGISIMPGLHFNQSSLFLRLGLSKALFKRTASSNHTNTRGNNYQRYFSGGHIGLGYRVSLIKRLFLQVDYIYTHYNMQSVLSSNGNGRAFSRDNSNEFLMGLFYQLGRKTTAAAHKTQLHLNALYLGMQGIMNTVMTKRRFSSSFIVHEKTGIHGGKLGLSAGYGHLFRQHLYLAGEITTQGVSNHYLGNLRGTRSKLRDGLRYGLSILPGYVINPSNMIYTRIGWQRGWFKKSGAVNDNFTEGPLFSTYSNGLRLGIGYTTALTSALALNTEYSYVSYRSFRSTNTAGSVITYRPRSYQVMLGLTYRFSVPVRLCWD